MIDTAEVIPCAKDTVPACVRQARNPVNMWTVTGKQNLVRITADEYFWTGNKAAYACSGSL